MTKREILMDWLSKKENRDKLPYCDLPINEQDIFDAYGQVLKYEEGSHIVCLGKTYFRIKKAD